MNWWLIKVEGEERPFGGNETFKMKIIAIEADCGGKNLVRKLLGPEILGKWFVSTTPFIAVS